MNLKSEFLLNALADPHGYILSELLIDFLLEVVDGDIW